jgi:hypothetical protein
MSTKVSYAEIDELMTEEDAHEVYRVLSEHGSTRLIEERWAAGEDFFEIIKEIVKELYREHEKRLLYPGYPIWDWLRDVQLAVYAVLDIDPPTSPILSGEGLGHGSKGLL